VKEGGEKGPLNLLIDWKVHVGGNVLADSDLKQT